MGEWQTLMARDGHTFNAWLSPPAGAPRGAVVVLQEIFGANAHIRDVADRFAAAGYLAIAPALFDRVGRNIEFGYGPDDIQRARGTRMQVKDADALKDIAASINVVKHAGRVALVGFCWGGTLAWIGARTLPIRAAVGYYVSRIGDHLDGAQERAVDVHGPVTLQHGPPAGRAWLTIHLNAVPATQHREPAGCRHLPRCGIHRPDGSDHATHR